MLKRFFVEAFCTDKFVAGDKSVALHTKYEQDYLQVLIFLLASFVLMPEKTYISGAKQQNYYQAIK